MFLAVSPTVSAVSLNTWTTDKSSYSQADTGTATVTFLNDQGALIQITAVDISFNYFYQDGRVYSQDFIVTGLSMNVTNNALSQPIGVKFSLPSDIAGGYFTPNIRMTFNQLSGAGAWSGDRQDNLAATKPLYILSQYQTLYQSAQTIEYAFIAASVLLLGTTGYFAMRYWSTKKPNNPAK
jgi:hypothetical protein